MAIHVVTPRSSQVLYGVNYDFKISPCGATHRKTGKVSVLHLAQAKPSLNTQNVDFEAVYSGTLVEPGEFKYVSEDGLLTIENTEAAIGIELDPADLAAIPLGEPIDFQIAVSTLHAGRDEFEEEA